MNWLIGAAMLIAIIAAVVSTNAKAERPAPPVQRSIEYCPFTEDGANFYWPCKDIPDRFGKA